MFRQEQLDAFADAEGDAAGLQERIRKAPKTSQSHLNTWQLWLAQEQLDAFADAEGDAAGLQERIATVERQLAAAQAEAAASKQELTSAKAALSSAKDELSSAEAALSDGQAAKTQMQVRLCGWTPVSRAQGAWLCGSVLGNVQQQVLRCLRLLGR